MLFISISAGSIFIPMVSSGNIRPLDQGKSQYTMSMFMLNQKNNGERFSFGVLYKFVLAKFSNHQKEIRNTGWLMCERILQMAIGLPILILLARFLDKEQFGIYNYVISFVSLFTYVTTLGIGGIAVRDIVKHPKVEKEIIGTAFGSLNTVAFFPQ